ncbi:permease [Cohnella sp. GCM10020058]|uniref:permease n=1 Tax=Cohnella sp. GCM10020058 TaxID=3317330 RepID=UPI00362ACD23
MNVTTAAERKPTPLRSNRNALLGLACIALLYLFTAETSERQMLHEKLQLFKTLFVGILLEALPFILIGVLIAALLHVFVTDEMIRRVIPRNPLLGILTATVLGIVFPICECGMVPAIRNLMRKGMPAYVASTFILVGPIMNPIVFWSTLMAFRTYPEIAYARMGLAFVVALVVGLIVYRGYKADPLRERAPSVGQTQARGHTHHGHEHHGNEHHVHEHHGHSHHEHEHRAHGLRSLRTRLAGRTKDVMGHAANEFFDMGKYLLIGAALVGLLQAFVSNATLVRLGQGDLGSHLLMMALGFALSLCSTSDAFVAQSFSASFSAGSLVAFMVFGPMMNLKGLIMMLAVFKARFVVLIASCVTVLVLLGSILLPYAGLK